MTIHMPQQLRDADTIEAALYTNRNSIKGLRLVQMAARQLFELGEGKFDDKARELYMRAEQLIMRKMRASFYPKRVRLITRRGPQH